MPVTWNEPDISIQIDSSKGDHEYLVEFQKGNDQDILLERDSEIYSGIGNIVGPLFVDHVEALATIELAGPGELEKQ